jgi:acyl carrier protein
LSLRETKVSVCHSPDLPSAAVLSVAERVVLVMAAACGIDRSEILPSSDLLALGIDSINLVGVVTQLQDSCGIVFSPEDALCFMQAKSVSSFTRIVEAAAAVNREYWSCR